jgi:hypothetical protein
LYFERDVAIKTREIRKKFLQLKADDKIRDRKEESSICKFFDEGKEIRY